MGQSRLFWECTQTHRTQSWLILEIARFPKVVRAYQEACPKVIACLERPIAWYLGDSLLVCFGYPLAHEWERRRTSSIAEPPLALLDSAKRGLFGWQVPRLS
jgi:hypothetical protein